MSLLQRTLRSPIEIEGIGLHCGKPIRLAIHPAPANSGIVFCRTDLPGMPRFKATPESVLDTVLATRIGSGNAAVATVEHLMAAFFGFGIDNAVVFINAEEMPILDGSALPFLTLLDEAGVRELNVPRSILVIKKLIEVVDAKNPERFIRIEPSKKPMLSYSIDFPQAQAIGKQTIHLDLSGTSFCEQLSFARTFCLDRDVEMMKSRGLAMGGSILNAIVVSPEMGVLNAHGLRSATEFVRHKALDCVGDLALLGMPLMGHVIAHKAGHDLHTALAKKLMLQMSEHTVLVPAQRSKTAVLFSFPQSLADFGHIVALQTATG